MSALAAFLRNHHLHLLVYLDYWLLLSCLESDLREQLRLLLQTNQELKFLVNWEKSELSPDCTPVNLGSGKDIPN